MNKRNLMAALAGAVAMFIWSAVAHVALPLGEAGIKDIPNEQAVMVAVQTVLGENRGMYAFPGMGTPPMTMDAYEKKLAVNPSGLLIYHPPGEKGMTPGQLGNEFATEFAECLLVVFLLAQTNLSGWMPRVGFVTAAGVLAAISTNVPYWNWIGFSAVFTLAAITTQIVAYLCAGLAIAVVLKNR